MKTSLYIHIPLCESKCGYCDFFSVPVSEFSDKETGLLLDSILKELALRLDMFQPDEIETVFIGGGTPSVLSPAAMDSFLMRLNKITDGLISGDAEFSVEANPESCSAEFISCLPAGRVNRLSLGIQSFDKKILEYIRRAAIPDEPFITAERIRSIWPHVFSLDIITGAGENYLCDIQKACALNPEHLSLYSLTIENETPLEKSIASGEKEAPDEALQAEAIEEGRKFLEKKGFARYEVSNYSKTGSADLRCRHNLRYWNMQSYIGIGPGAVSSFYDGEPRLRYSNITDIKKYINEIQLKKPAADRIQQTEELTYSEFLFEHYFMGMRLTSGVDRDIFHSRFGCSPQSLIPETIGKWSGMGLADPETGALNSRGMLLLDSCISDIWDELNKGPLKTAVL